MIGVNIIFVIFRFSLVHDVAINLFVSSSFRYSSRRRRIVSTMANDDIVYRVPGMYRDTQEYGRIIPALTNQ